MARLRSERTVISKRKVINGSARAVASPPANTTSTNNENTVSKNTIGTAENDAPNPAPITPVDENLTTTATTIENHIVDNPGPMIADAALLCDEDAATDDPATSTTEDPALKNPSATITDAAFTCDAGNTSENPAPPTSDTGVTTAHKTATPPTETTITEPATNNATPSIKQGNAPAHDSSAASSIQNTDTAVERSDPPRAIQDNDAPFELDDETSLDPNVSTNPENSQPVSQLETEKTGRRSERRPRKRGLEPIITKPNSLIDAIIIDDEPVDSGPDRSDDVSDDVPVSRSVEQVLRYRQRHVEKMKSSLDNLISYIESTADSDQSADYDDMRGGWKRSFDNFITTKLDNSDQPKVFANDLLDEIRKYQGCCGALRDSSSDYSPSICLFLSRFFPFISFL